VGGTQTAQAGDLVCVAYCSPDQPGTPVAEIRWEVGSQPTSSEIRRTATQQNVEVAVNEDGFDRGRFVRLPSLNPQARFAPAAPPAGGAPLPGLGDLTVRAVTSSQESAGAMRLATPAAAGQENVVVQVQGLRPGLNYYWRVRASTPGQTQVVMCRAPVCPVDRRK
jgi:phosphodiesterase/alkaline phosphatase D-like protein